MIKTTNLTKTVYNTNPVHSQPINLYTPSTTSSSGSICDTDPPSISSSYKSNNGINDEINHTQQDDSSITLIDKLKRELAIVKQAKSQLATLYKVKCKSDLDKSAKITKLRLQFEYELNTFCKQDQKDLVCYLQRQLLMRDQRINELSYDIEQLKNSTLNNNENQKTEPIQILRCNDPDLVISTNRRLYDEQGRTLQRENIELNDRLKKFERQLEVIKHDQSKDHDKELIKRALAKQAFEYNKFLAKKDEQLQQLNERIKQFSQSNQLESALRQSNIEKLYLEKRLLSSTSSLNSTTTTNAGPTTATTTSTSTSEEQPSSPRISTPSSPSHIDPIQQQAMQKTTEVLRAEIHRLTQSNEDSMNKLKLQVQRSDELQEAYKYLETKYNQLLDNEEHYKKEKNSYETCLHENEQLKQKINLLETELLTSKSTQSHHQDLQINIEQLQKELQLGIKERETTSMLNAQLRNEITNLTNTNERLTEECEKLRIALIAKSDEYDSKQRENEQLKTKNTDLELIIKSIRDTNDIQKRLNDENEINKAELKKKQDDFEQFQKMHDTTKREHQGTISLLQDKIHDLERKTELQSLKHEEILLQFESLKKRPDRKLPSSTGSSFSNNNNNNHPSLLPIMIDSQTSIIDDSAPIPSSQRITNLQNKSAKIVVAKYSYEPLRFSPNDHPEIELPLKIGEYYLIYGDIDEDGFYDGRNLEGRYGLIPSNFIELVTNPVDLPENIKHIIQKLTGKNFPNNERNSRQREQTTSLESDVFINNSSLPIPKLINSISSDISTDDLSFGKHIPHPTNLRVEKLLSNSVLIAWNPPLSNIQILGYQVLFDHSLFTTIHINERTRALIENINLNEKSHRISIRTITQHGLSRDQQCTLLLTNSKDLSFIPTDLRIDKITQTTAVVSWWPASNDISHKLYVNDIEVQTLKPGIYRFKLSGLLPNTSHKVTIKAKPSGITTPQQQLSAHTEFRTMPFDDSIQPPRRIQVIPGPQANTLLVSWEQSSTTNTTRGYRVLIDGRQVQDVTNPLNDHTVLNLNTAYPGRYLTIRTLTDNGGESHDSSPIDLDDVFKKTSRPLPIISQDLSVSINNGKERKKSLTRSSLESPSTVSSISTDTPQIELKVNTPRSPTRLKQRDSSESNRNRTPTNENLNINKSVSSEEQRSMPPTPIKNVRLQSPSEIINNNNNLRNKTNTSPKLFVALFDYDPHAMSPNQDSEEELPFKQGQIIKIYGDQDPDGFYIGQIENGRTGFVPSNMVSEIEVENSETESHVSSGTFISSPTKRTPPLPISTNSKLLKKMIAVFDYNPNANSPNKNHNDELSFHSGDIIYIHGNIRDDGFYSGELANGRKGLVPSNYLKEITDEIPIQKVNEVNDSKQASINVNNEAKSPSSPSTPSTTIPTPTPPPSSTPAPASTAPPPTEAPTAGFFDRIKSTFSWNSNEPI